MIKSIVASRRKATAFTLVEIMIVVLIIGILLAIAIPNFVAARETSRAKACVANLKQIDSATQQWCMDNKKSATNYGSGPVIATDLVGTDSYIRAVPVCPSGGSYSAATDINSSPTCDISSPGSGDYASGGKYYHGL
jgi:prepilin-type N-terminal cleavage/methylation domain-containing protein